jgi:predicted nucleic acid-binding protein
MSGKYFLDTNIFVYAFSPDDPTKAKLAHDLIVTGVSSQQGIVSYQVVQEFFNVTLRGFAQRMTVAEAEQFLTSVFRPLLAVHSSPILYLEALRLFGRYKMPWYDSLIVAAALQAKCETLYSEDFQHGQEIEGVKIQNPFLLDDSRN